MTDGMRPFDSQIAEARHLMDSQVSSRADPEFVSWRTRCAAKLRHELGASHPIVEEFEGIRWVPTSYAGTVQGYIRAGLGVSIGLLEGAGYDLQLRASSRSSADTVDFDVELFDHIQTELLAEAWGKVAALTVIFTEDRIRSWAGRPAEEVGEKLMTAVLGDSGDFKLGRTAGERQGWHRFAMGLFLAARNVVGHRLQIRQDERQYAMGVVGAASLLLTQLRWEHSNRFVDTQPTGPIDLPIQD